MPLSQSEAAKLAHNEYQRGIMHEVITTNEVMRAMPIAITRAPGVHYARENSLSSGGFIAYDGTVSEGAATFSEVNKSLCILAGQVKIYNFLGSQYSTYDEQVATQVRLKVKATTRTLEQKIVEGTGAAGEIEGWETLTPAGQTIASSGANGDALSFEALDALLDDKLLLRSGQVVLTMNSALVRKLRALYRALGAADIPTVALGDGGYSVPHYRGYPVLTCNWIPSDEAKGSASTLSSVYALNLDEAEGVSLVMGMQSATADNLAGEGPFAVERVGLVESEDATIYRVKMYVQQVLKSTKSIARAKELITA